MFEYVIRIDEINGNEIVKSEIEEEIIRCRDCKEHHGLNGLCNQWSTGVADVYTSDNGFCYMAEKKVD